MSVNLMRYEVKRKDGSTYEALCLEEFLKPILRGGEMYIVSYGRASEEDIKRIQGDKHE